MPEPNSRVWCQFRHDGSPVPLITKKADLTLRVRVPTMNRPLMLDLSPDEAKIVVMDVLAALSGSGSLANGSANETALVQARANAGNDMLRQMQTVFPLAVQVSTVIYIHTSCACQMN